MIFAQRQYKHDPAHRTGHALHGLPTGESQTRVYIRRFTMHFMNEESTKKNTPPSALRLAAAVFLGLIVGFILFLVAALFIGMFNKSMNMNIPVGMDVAENLLSALLLIIFVGGSIAGFCWKVWVTPPTEEEESTLPEN